MKSRAITLRGGLQRFPRPNSGASAVVILAATSALAACQSASPTSTPSMLSAAGFVIRPADSAVRQDAIAALQPRTVTMQRVNGKNVFLYADPGGCNCLYVGNEASYQAYRRMAFERSIASQQLMAAQMNAQTGWDYRVWGPGWWW